ncbi:Bud-site selection protein [Meredithblackwellia eburnea MCA 4105]
MPAQKRQRSENVSAAKESGKRRKPSHSHDTRAPQTPEQQQEALKVYFHHALKSLLKAVKIARTFETQKVARKLKTIREPKERSAAKVDEDQLPALEASLTALKALPIADLPTSLLHSRLPKLPYQSLKPLLPTLLSTLPKDKPSKDSEDEEQAKAKSRVLGNKVVKEAWEEVARAVGKRMGEEVAPRKAEVKPNKEGAVKGVSGSNNGLTKEEAAAVGEPTTEKRLSKRALRALKASMPKPPKPGMNAARQALIESGVIEGDSDEEERGLDDFAEFASDETGVGGSDFGEMDDEAEIQKELARFGGKGDASDSDADSEDGNSDDSDEGPVDDFDDSDQQPDSGDEDEGVSPPPRPAKKTKQDKEKRKPITSSAFLPSLASGYISYSDSDGEDAKWVKEAEKGDKKERKNRRGQRARRAIWEQKYGSGAKHLVKEQGGKPAPSGGKAKAKGGRAEKMSRQKADSKPFDPSSVTAFKGAPNPNAEPVGVRKASKPDAPPKPAGAVHPSWEAKKKLADAAKIQAGAKPMGKKITFD